MKKILLSLLFIPLSAYASGPSTPEDPNEVAQVVLVAKPLKVEQKLYLAGRAFSKDDAKKYLEAYQKRSDKNFPNGKEQYPRFQVEYLVTLQVSKAVKGGLVSDTVKVRWKDLAGSMCPHIPLRALTKEGIWYTGSQVKKGEHDHSIYWIDNIKENLSAISGNKKVEK